MEGGSATVHPQDGLVLVAGSTLQEWIDNLNNQEAGDGLNN